MIAHRGCQFLKPYNYIKAEDNLEKEVKLCIYTKEGLELAGLKNIRP